MSGTVFNLSRKVPTYTDIKDLEKGLDFAPIKKKLNEAELRRDCKDFCRCTRLEGFFRDESPPFFSGQLYFSPKSPWSSPASHPILEIFLSQIEHELFWILDKSLAYSNLTKASGKPTDLLLMIDL